VLSSWSPPLVRSRSHRQVPTLGQTGLLEKAIKDAVEKKLSKGHADDKMFVSNTSSCKT